MTRAIVLAEGRLGHDEGKTANGLVLHSMRDEIVAVIDSTQAGRDAGDVVAGRPRGIPVVATLNEALQHDASTLYIGVAPVGGRLPPTWRGMLETCLQRGMTIVSGLHTFLSDDAALMRIAETGGGKIVDVRRPPEPFTCATGAIYDLDTPRVLVMGTDCAVGKRMTVVELVRAARARGLDAGFVATGQTGCMLGPDAGAVIDRIPGDFMAGQVEKMIVSVAGEGRSPVFVYGQASILHPAYSGVALGILHGTRPHAVILQHDPARRQRTLFSHPAYQVAAVEEEIALIERIGDTKVVGIAVNGKNSKDIDAACRRLEEATGLPAEDPLRHGAERLVTAALAHLDALGLGVGAAVRGVTSEAALRRAP